MYERALAWINMTSIIGLFYYLLSEIKKKENFFSSLQPNSANDVYYNRRILVVRQFDFNRELHFQDISERRTRARANLIFWGNVSRTSRFGIPLYSIRQHSMVYSLPMLCTAVDNGNNPPGSCQWNDWNTLGRRDKPTGSVVVVRVLSFDFFPPVQLFFTTGTRKKADRKPLKFDTNKHALVSRTVPCTYRQMILALDR